MGPFGARAGFDDMAGYLGDQLGLDVSGYTDVDARSRALGTFLHGRKLLVVLDDVWRERDAEYFLVVSSASRIVVTTRDVSVAANLSDGRHQNGTSVDPLSHSGPGCVCCASLPQKRLRPTPKQLKSWWRH